ncbi:MAG: DNA polymerase IV [Mycoplasmataceae bacterium]|jgi:DNA polymerase-4|nr:DNA polymerase IV [Mycoplasmataceae bacterium]
MKKTTILHVDMNCFFCSVEELLNPKLSGKPIAVGGKSRRSVVSSPNYIARQYGVKAAMPMYKALQKCPNLIVVESHFDKYEKYSNDFITLLKENFTNQVEIASIDECYIDITKILNKKTPQYFAIKIQNTIKNKLGLNVSIGIGTNRFTAKMASGLKKPLGIQEINSSNIAKTLWSLPIEEMHMVGPATASALKKINILTIGDLAKSDSFVLQKYLGKRAVELIHNANGKSSSELILSSKPKSFSKRHTFEYDTNNYDEITNQIKLQTKDVYSQLQHTDKLQNTTISIVVKTNRLTTISKSKTLSGNINYEIVLSGLLELYENNFYNKTIRLIGVCLSNF